MIKKTLENNEIPNSYNNFLDFLFKFLIKNLLKDSKKLSNQ